MTGPVRSLIGLDELSNGEIEAILSTASAFEEGTRDHHMLMSNMILVPLFFQESSRTYINSTTSFVRMGGTVLPLTIDNTRLNSRWSEPIRDFCQLLNACCDLVIVRSPDAETVLDFARWCEKPIINAGNGAGTGSEHPVQSLVDLYVIRKRYGENPIKLLMIGGKHIRTTRTQTKLFRRFDFDVDLIASDVAADNHDMDSFYSQNVREYRDVREIDLSRYDVIYHNGADEDPNANPGDNIFLNKELLQTKNFRGIVMHSLPRLKELSTDLDDTTYNYYYQQMIKSKYIFQSVFDFITQSNNDVIWTNKHPLSPIEIPRTAQPLSGAVT